jgi:hypothetical protein
MTGLMIGLINGSTATKLIVGCLLLIGLLQGCTSPFVDVKVKVDSCPPAGTRVVTTPSAPSDEVGACSLGSVIPNDTPAHQIPAWHVTLNRYIEASDNLKCKSTSVMKRCQSSPGTCYGQACKTKFYPNGTGTGHCYCQCP